VDYPGKGSYPVNDSTVATENTPPDSTTERTVSFQRSVYDPGYVNAMSHFYRGELGRIMIWRQRLDITTNWAITSSTAIITIAFSSREVPHIVFFFNLAILWVLLWIIGVHQVEAPNAPFLILLGAIGGYLVVPMNALLQHRGANLMGAGRSIAVQNFNEQACILGLSAFYTGMTKVGLSAFTAIALFGTVVAATMWLVLRWHKSNRIKYREELDHLLAIARSDKH